MPSNQSRTKPHPSEDRDLRYSLNFLAIAMVFLGVVYLTPHAGSGWGQSFFAGARSTEWQNFGDWLAAWCSIKIILFSIAGFFLLLSFEEILLYFRRHKVANLLILILALPVTGFGVGFYYLVKSVL
jgi:hypothetical protein